METNHTDNVEKEKSFTNTQREKNLSSSKLNYGKVKPGELPVKEFMPRNSLLTDLINEDKNISTVYNIFVALLVGLLITTAAQDYFYKGKILLGIPLIIKGFSKLHLLLFAWSCIFLSTVVIYYGFKFWAITRIQLTPKSTNLKLWDYLCLTIFMVYYPSVLYFSARATIVYDTAIAESMVFLIDMVRILMKVHAFVRSNAPRVLKYKLHTEEKILVPEFSKFLYFSFAPTLLYRDSYPRSKHIEWKFVAVNFLEVIGVVFLCSLMYGQFFDSAFKDYGLKPFTWRDVLIKILESVGVVGLTYKAISHALIHSWQNAFAEMLRFSDRMFYKDWWTSSNYMRYFRTWNTIVHEWIYTYIYKDFYEIVLPNNKSAAKLAAFSASFLFHDFCFSFSFRFHSPIFPLIAFGGALFGHFIYTTHERIGNIFFVYSEAFGICSIMSIFICEYFVRINCPIENPTFSSYFIPRMLTCDNQMN